jgi:TonB family protein
MSLLLSIGEPMTIKASWLAIFFILCIPALRADDTSDLQKKLEHRFLRQVRVIRNFYSGDHLVFDAQGNLLQGDNSIGYDGCRCIAELAVRKLELKKNQLVLRGSRMVGDYDGNKTDLSEFSSLSNEHTQVEIDVVLDEKQMNEETIAGVLDKIFFTDKDDIRAHAPVAWKAREPAVLAQATGKISDPPLVLQGINKLGKGVKAPEAIYSPDPEYSDEARAAKIEGTVVMWIVISGEGNVTTVKIVRCLGYGLDESAVRAVSQWRFKPATKDGNPIAVQVNVAVTFHQ